MKKFWLIGIFALFVAIIILSSEVASHVYRDPNRMAEAIMETEIQEIDPFEYAIHEPAPLPVEEEEEADIQWYEEPEEPEIEPEEEYPEEEPEEPEEEEEEPEEEPEEEAASSQAVTPQQPQQIQGETSKPTEDEVYRVICIGDSVTAHPYMAEGTNPYGYWLQDWGMAASAREKDYAHVLARMLENKSSKVELSVINFNEWELAEAKGIPRSAYLGLLDPLFTKDQYQADLVVLQLGENVTAFQNFAYDLEYLIDYIRSYSPSAQIIITGTIIRMDENRNNQVDSIKQNVCISKGCAYADMLGYNETMWVGEGAQIVNPQGQVTVISLTQRTHPGDNGMQWIAQQIYNWVS